MNEKFIFQIAKHNLENANSKISELIENYNAILNDKLKDENQSMDVYRTLLIFSMKKVNFSVRTSDDRVIDLNGGYSNSQEQGNLEK